MSSPEPWNGTPKRAATGPGRPGRDARPAAPTVNLPDPRGRIGSRWSGTACSASTTSGDTSGYGLLVRQIAIELSSPRPYGSYFDEIADRAGRVLGATGRRTSVTPSSGSSSTAAS
jgi:hypothetical protein